MKYINFLIKPASSSCNLRCKYCFYEDIAENRTVKNMGLMKEETVEILLKEAFNLIEEHGEVHFGFQGGEPTLAGLDFFKNFTKRAEELCPEKVTVSYALQTNGVLIDEEWAHFFKENDFLIGLSLDGFSDLHNLNRIDAKQNDTYNKVLNTFNLLEKTGVNTNILCVVTSACAKKSEKVYNELKKIGAKYIQFIPCLDPIDTKKGSTPFSLTPKLYTEFLCKIFDLWFKDYSSGNYISIRAFDDYVNIILGKSAGTCATCGRCGSYLVVEGDGGIYPCDFFVLDEWKMGTLGENPLLEIAESENAKKFLNWGQEKPEECYSCKYRILCNGGCKNDWITENEKIHNYYCPAFKKFFEYAEQRLLMIARNEKRFI